MRARHALPDCWVVGVALAAGYAALDGRSGCGWPASGSAVVAGFAAGG